MIVREENKMKLYASAKMEDKHIDRKQLVARNKLAKEFVIKRMHNGKRDLPKY